MNTTRQKLISFVRVLFFALFPTLGLLGIRVLTEVQFGWEIFLQLWLFVVVIWLIAFICQPEIDSDALMQFQPKAIGLFILTIIIGILYSIFEETILGWFFVGCIYSVLLSWIDVLGSGLLNVGKVLLEGIFTAVAGLLPALVNQIETRFSTEEFFVALEVAGLIFFWLILRIAFAFWKRRKIPKNDHNKYQIQRRWFLAGLGLTIFAGLIFTGCEYQRSFYPLEAPDFPGVSAETPFICGETNSSDDVYPGSEVFQDLLEKVEANPNKSTPEFAFLALGTMEQKWADEFRGSILAEAKAGSFTHPVGSVKYGQYLASKRAYYYPLVSTAFPDLFSSGQEKIILDWFAAINQRTFSVEWVDWLYALAFRYWPQGPYENQESGAGLLALLELNGLADPTLSGKNQQYLVDNPRGWLTRFRVTDDAAVYQPEWIENAWYQAMYSRDLDHLNQAHSFEWLKLMALPDGSPLRYNHLGSVDYATRAYWGANLLEDQTLLWLAGRALDYLADNSTPAVGQPGVEELLTISGKSPTIGSCLIYGDSGLPTQLGPIAPDKIVFRSGWDADDLYLSLNLRFTGWHRYKATNALMQIYKGEPLVIENSSGENFSWLPTGRTLFRDKRIPRENLNGLQIAKTGLAAVLYQITGIGGPWAQDPPYYAEVTRFDSTPEFTVSSTRIKDWHGWDHLRTIYFYPEGIVAIIDNAQGLTRIPAMLTWHFVSDSNQEESFIRLGNASNGLHLVKVVPLMLNSNKIEYQSRRSAEGLPILRMEYQASKDANINAATIFLFDNWIDADIQVENQTINIRKSNKQKIIPLENWLSMLSEGEKVEP